MIFPINHTRKQLYYIYTDTGTIREQVFGKVIEKLNEGYFKNLKINDYKVTFRGTLFRFVWNGWNIFNGITGGNISIELPEENRLIIKHKVYFTEAIFLALAFTLLPLAMLLAGQQMLGYIALAAIWLILFLGNYIVSVVRLGSFLDDTVKEFYEDMIKA